MHKITHNHPFHFVTESPWPLLMSFSLMNLLMIMTMWFNNINNNFTTLIMFKIYIESVIIVTQWWNNINREAFYQGSHTILTQKNMKIGMIMFISSEVFFFISFFWTFFHMFLSPSIEIGTQWPPLNIHPFNNLSIPLLNTLILITSGISLTWSHHSLLKNNFKESSIGLIITILLGLYFSSLQLMEYNEAPFSINDSCFGSIFFVATGFHGLHVIIGTTFLIVCLMKLLNLQYSPSHHFSFEAASWYWHFVDIVWLFLFINIY
uniref:cytochrome c oxidase subunit III n=1 Tax=Sclerodermus sichuanensis TaxID=592144 RepID=UPI002115A30C|nr:cytochrome c oxidase subunit III [Sclerodermus sichuanensis]UTN43173.1 cytochrome c oxidase subunit III [Sclerodermus sichuanensis]